MLELTLMAVLSGLLGGGVVVSVWALLSLGVLAVAVVLVGGIWLITSLAGRGGGRHRSSGASDARLSVAIGHRAGGANAGAAAIGRRAGEVAVPRARRGGW